MFDRLHGNLPISAIESEKKCKKEANKQAIASICVIRACHHFVKILGISNHPENLDVCGPCYFPRSFLFFCFFSN